MSSAGESGWETASEEMPEPGPSGASAEVDARLNKGLMQHGCQHYRRRCKLIAPCCNGQAFWCRHCHNKEKSDEEQDPSKRHMLDRRAVTELECALCMERQPVADKCRACGVSFGRYSCLECNFFDDDVSKQQFHCDACGICRVGGRENFFHCSTCSCCYAIGLRESHVCVENSMHHNCPVCWEYLFDSIKPINVLPCGHTIHQECLRNLVEHNTYTCPCCFKSFMAPSSMERLWQELDLAVASTPMPEEYRGMSVNIQCNDCQARCAVRFHVIGHKCSSCGSYNTRRV